MKKPRKNATQPKSLNCDHCEKEFLVTQELWFKRIKDKNENGYNTYCSQTCRSAGKISRRRPKILVCDHCNENFEVTPKQWTARRSLKKAEGMRTFCGRACQLKGMGREVKTIIKCNCEECGNDLERSSTNKRRYPLSFCDPSCAITYKNKLRQGHSRSKLEVYLEERLLEEFSFLNFLFNDRQKIGLELDIYLPELNLAFEINGIFHYLPIFGQKKLEETQERDFLKNRFCSELGIKVVTIDVRKMQFNLKSGAPIFDHISEEILKTLQVINSNF